VSKIAIARAKPANVDVIVDKKENGYLAISTSRTGIQEPRISYPSNDLRAQGCIKCNISSSF
jgi:hypothetical protein